MKQTMSDIYRKPRTFHLAIGVLIVEQQTNEQLSTMVKLLQILTSP